MKAKDYKNKYEFDDANKTFDHTEFMKDMTEDFNQLLTTRQKLGALTEKCFFTTVVRDFRAKFESVSRISNGKVGDRQWSYLYATVVVPKRNELFGAREGARA